MDAILPLLFPATFVAMLLLERLVPARPLPKIRWWLPKGILFFVLTSAVAGSVPALVAAVLRGRTLADLSVLGTVVGALLAFVAGDLPQYLVHRTMHNVPWLWRWTHQMHHSAERLDVAGASYFHPFDIALQTGATTLAVALLGVSPHAAMLAGFLGFFAAQFQHLNVRTLQWIGWFIQRPEAHAVHHARGVHAYNYGNVTVWDMLFGTFRNPAGFTESVGFWDGASNEVGAMLLGRDVSEGGNHASHA